jgi:hypothetical protein
MAATVSRMLAEARREIGTKENPPGSNRQPYAAEARHANGQPWCATFLVALARRVGLSLPSESPYTPAMAEAFRKAGRWHVSDPQPGDFAFFDFPDGSKRIQHVGIVESVPSRDEIVTIEGNTGVGNDTNGGMVMRRRRPRRYVVGYGRPAYAPEPPPAPERPWAMVKGYSPELAVLPHLLRAADPAARSGPHPLRDLVVRVVDPKNMPPDVPAWSMCFGFADSRWESVAGPDWSATVRLICARLGLCGGRS